MSFPKEEVEALLVACHRRCCICHRFCGVKMEVDHMVPQRDAGLDTIDNAIPVCFECHAEIHSYNDKHPRGRKFQPGELRRHKELWLDICRREPEALLNAARNADVGPLQALIDELEFNQNVAQYSSHDVQGCLFRDEQFARAISEGAIAMLNDELKSQILDAYLAIGRANQHLSGVMAHEPDSNAWAGATQRATHSMIEARPKIGAARRTMLTFMSSNA